jgi:hypothetical protein
MKTQFTFTLLVAAAAIGMAQAQTAYTTPVGYYDFDAKAGGNIFVPGLIESPVFAGAITAAGTNTVTVATEAITAGAFNETPASVSPSFPARATHYVEITQAGGNQGVVIDIESNTNSVITLASDISALSLAGTETILVRPHVTLASAFAGAEPSLAAFGDNATFYNPDGTGETYYFIASGEWSSNFADNDGGARPIPPGTGVIFFTGADVGLTITGEVSSSDVVVQITGGGVINIVGPVNPLVGDSALIKDLGFADMVPYGDNITIYPPGDLETAINTYYALGDGTVSTDFVNPSNDTFSFTKGAIFTAGADAAFKVKSGLP